MVSGGEAQLTSSGSGDRVVFSVNLRAVLRAGAIVLVTWMAGTGCATGEFRHLKRGALLSSRPATIVAPPLPAPTLFVNKAEVAPLVLVLVAPLIIGAVAVGGYAARTMAAGTIPSGKELRNDRGLQDPAITIRERLLDELVETYELTVIATARPASNQVDATSGASGGTSPVVSTVATGGGQPTKPDALADTPGADLRLEVSTLGWKVSHLGGGRYGLSYTGTLKLIDTRSGTVVAEGVCRSAPAERGVSVKQTTDRNVELLREDFEATAEYCADEYRRRVLGIYH